MLNYFKPLIKATLIIKREYKLKFKSKFNFFFLANLPPKTTLWPLNKKERVELLSKKGTFEVREGLTVPPTLKKGHI